MIKAKRVSKLKGLSDDEVESEREWIFEARGEGYTWKQLAKKYQVSVQTLKKFCGK